MLTAINLIQVAVEFNMDVTDRDGIDSKDNYSFEDAEIADVEVNDNKVVLTLTEDVAQQTNETLTVSSEILDEKSEFSVYFFDTTIPRALSAQVVGSNTIKVKFSEPLDVAELTRSERRDGFTLKDADGKTKYVDDVTFSNNNTEANVTFYSEFEEEVYTLTVENEYKDYAGYTVVKEVFDGHVAVDEDAPVVIGYKNAKPYEVTLIFDEDIKVVGEVSDFYHTNSSNAANQEPTTDGNELKITFDPSDRLPSGTAYVYVGAESVEDLWGNKNDQQYKIEVEVVADETAPVIEKVEATAQNIVEVTFDEALDETTAQEEDNYKILDDEGEEIEDIVVSAVLNSDGDVVTLTLGEDISGDNTLVVEDVEDIYGNEISKVEFDFFADDVTSPDYDSFDATLYDAEVQTLIIDFGEAMAVEGSYSVVDLEKYKVTNDGTTWKELADLDGVSIAAIDGNKKVEIRLDTVEAEYSFAEGVDYIKLARVADAAGNKTDDLVGYIDITEAATVGMAKAEATALDTLVVELDDVLVEFDDEDFDVYVLNGAEKVALPVAEVDEDSSGDATIITFTMDQDLNYDGTFTGTIDGVDFTDATVYIATRDAASVVSVNEYDLKVAIAETGIDDKIAPEITDAEDVTVVGDEITLVFTEGVSSSVTSVELTATDIVIKDGDDTLVAGVDYTVTADGTANVVITLINDYVGFTGELTISLSADAKYLKDSNDNVVAEFDTIEVEL